MSSQRNDRVDKVDIKSIKEMTILGSIVGYSVIICNFRESGICFTANFSKYVHSIYIANWFLTLPYNDAWKYLEIQFC